MSSGLAVVPGSKPKQETKKEPPLVRTRIRSEAQKKKLQKARRVTDSKKGSIGKDLDYEVKVEKAKIADLDVGEPGHIFVKLRCAYCGELVEGQGLGALNDFVEDYLKIFKNPRALHRKGDVKPANKMKTFERTCAFCGFIGIRGRINVRIRDDAIDRAKEHRFRDEREEEVFGGVVSFKEFTIKGGNFPKYSRYLEKDVPAVLLYVCGTCGRIGWALELQQQFAKLLKEVDNAWRTGESIEPKKVDVKFICRDCANEMRTSGVVGVNFPKTRKEITQAMELWQRDAHQLVFEKTRLPLSLDFEQAFYKARKAEKTKGGGD